MLGKVLKLNHYLELCSACQKQKGRLEKNLGDNAARFILWEIDLSKFNWPYAPF